MQAVFGHLIVFAAAEALHAVLLLCAECTNTSFAPQTSPSPVALRSVDRAVVGVGAIMAPCRRLEELTVRDLLHSTPPSDDGRTDGVSD